MSASQAVRTMEETTMQSFNRWQLMIAFLFMVLSVTHLTAVNALAQPDFFNSKGCVNCHSAPVVKSCNACHKHGANKITGKTDKAAYAPGEPVAVTIDGGSKNGWLRAVLYDQSRGELARSTGNASGMGSSTTLPAVLTAAAPTVAGTYTWQVAWYGNAFGRGSSGSGSSWVADPTNPNHGEVLVNTNSFTVTGPPDNTAPTVNTFTLPATSTSLTVPVTSFTATDDVAVTGYLVTTSSSSPLPGVAGWQTTAPTSVAAPAAGTFTFYAWARDAAGNVSLSSSATVTVTVTVIDKVRPKVTAFTLPATSTSLTVPVASFTATDNIGVVGYLITTTKSAPSATAVAWSATAPTTATATTTNKAGKATFYAWAKDAANRVSRARKATVKITPTALPADLTNPALAVSTLSGGTVTRDLTLNISGRASDEGELRSVTINGTSASIAPDGTFSSALILADGANVVTVAATDAAGNQSVNSRALFFDSVAPELVITDPADNLMSARSPLYVRGKASEDATVMVQVNDDNQLMALRSNDDFSANVYLVPGLNTVMITVADPAGNVSSAKRTIIYDNSKPTLAITEPCQDMATRNAGMQLKGTVADSMSAVSVSIAFDGKIYMPSIHDGTFVQELHFTKESCYTITVTATDAAENSVSVTRNVIYKVGSAE